MNTINWKSLNSTPSDFNELKENILKSRKMEYLLEDSTTSLKDFFKDPTSVNFSIEDLKEASNIISTILKEEKGVVVHGDYDVDGITSTAILYESLLSLGFTDSQIQLFLPNRFNHGYGFSEKSYTEIKGNFNKKDYPLIILTDCGISSITTIKEARKEGYLVIVIDHHQKKEILPEANAVFWNDKLTASVLAYFFSKYMEAKLLSTTNLLNGVDLAGLGYVCDLGNISLPIGREVTKSCLKVLNSSPREGIKQLLLAAEKDQKILTSYDLGWVLGPRLNSSGRMTDPIKSLNLLIKKDLALDTIALELDTTNSERQDTTKEMYEEAVIGLSNKKFIGLDEDHKIILAHSPNFHEGVIGLISSQLVKNFYKPSICVSWEDTLGKGSCRSVAGVNIVEVLKYCSEYLEDFGGHEQAAGFSIKKENYPNFEQKLIEYGRNNISEELLTPTTYFDSEVKIEFLNQELLKFIDILEPFGNGNPSPLFVLKNALLDEFKVIGKDSTHLSFKLSDTNLRAIFFNGSKYLEGLTNRDYYNLLFSFEKNEWKGTIYPQLVIKDIQPADF